MSEFEKQEDQDGFYGTGRTQPPKSHSGFIATILILLIFTGGIISLTGILRIRLFQQLTTMDTEPASPVSFSALMGEDDTRRDTSAPTDDFRLDIASTPQSPDNILKEGGLSLQEIYTRSIDSVVSITCSREDSTSTGTGVVLSTDGYIVTNCHVIDGASTIWVRFTDRRELTATVVGKDAMSDLAVLHVEANALKPAQFGDSGAVRVGDAVVAIGDPLGAQLRGTMTDGIISAINRDVTVGGRTMTLLQTNAALNAGNSGGPLINCYGQVIGINTMKLAGNDGQTSVEGLGFAIPSQTVKEVVDQLLEKGYVPGRPTLALTGETVSGLYQRYYGWPAGFCVTELQAGGAADNAGIQPGDIITHFAQQRITDADSLRDALFAYQSGDQVAVVVYRNGRYHTAVLTIGTVE